MGVYMSVQNLRKQDSPSVSKPLQRTQAFIVELKVCVKLVRELRVELEGLLVIALLLAVFAVGAIYIVQHLHP